MAKATAAEAPEPSGLSPPPRHVASILHRFANVEVKVPVVQHLPGYRASIYFGTPSVPVQTLKAAMGDVDKYVDSLPL